MDNMDEKVFNEAARKEFKRLIRDKLIFKVTFIRKVAQRLFIDGIRFGVKEAGDHVRDVFKELVKKGGGQ